MVMVLLLHLPATTGILFSEPLEPQVTATCGFSCNRLMRELLVKDLDMRRTGDPHFVQWPV
jgi:hypothetical protein